MNKAKFTQLERELLAAYKIGDRLRRQSVEGIAREDRETWAREMGDFLVEKHRVYRAIREARE